MSQNNYFTEFNLSRVCPIRKQNPTAKYSDFNHNIYIFLLGFVKISLIIKFLHSFGEKRERFPRKSQIHNLHLPSHLFEFYKNSNCCRQDKGRIWELPVVG